MNEIEDIDLAKALDMLAKRLARMARDIFHELDSPTLGIELANILDETSRLLRGRALKQSPKVIELDAANELTDDDRLAAGLTILAYQLTMVVSEIRGGLFDQAERHELADALQDMAVDVRGQCPDPPPDPDGR